MENSDHSNPYSNVTLKIGNMQCDSCVLRIESALTQLSGVSQAIVDLGGQCASITYDPAKISEDQIKAALAKEGYPAVDDINEAPLQCCDQPIDWFSYPRAYLFGALAVLAIIGIYLGMNTLTADWYFARVQFSEYRWWIIALAIGLGIQVTLFTSFRAHLKGLRTRAAASSMVASGGVSATAMMACCSHYLATVIPALGLPFLSATAVASLAEYQIYFFLAGVISCLIGIGLMLRMMEKHGMIQLRGLKNFLPLRPDRVRG